MKTNKVRIYCYNSIRSLYRVLFEPRPTAVECHTADTLHTGEQNKVGVVTVKVHNKYINSII